MINLLPSNQKDSIKYARQNVKLMNLGIKLGLVILALLALVGAGQLYINSSINNYTKLVEDARNELQTGELENTQQRVTDLSNNITLVINVLSKEILFSKLISQAGAVMPEGSVLSSLQITEVKGGIDLDALAVDYTTATQVQVNLEDPENKLFEKVDINDVACEDNPSKKYPCTVSLRALFADNNPYLFINENQGEQS